MAFLSNGNETFRRIIRYQKLNIPSIVANIITAVVSIVSQNLPVNGETQKHIIEEALA
jgi:hypothetical protein